jgi:hypothetical protein
MFGDSLKDLGEAKRQAQAVQKEIRGIMRAGEKISPQLAAQYKQALGTLERVKSAQKQAKTVRETALAAKAFKGLALTGFVADIARGRINGLTIAQGLIASPEAIEKIAKRVGASPKVLERIKGLARWAPVAGIGIESVGMIMKAADDHAKWVKDRRNLSEQLATGNISQEEFGYAYDLDRSRFWRDPIGMIQKQMADPKAELDNARKVGSLFADAKTDVIQKGFEKAGFYKQLAGKATREFTEKIREEIAREGRDLGRPLTGEERASAYSRAMSREFMVDEFGKKYAQARPRDVIASILEAEREDDEAKSGVKWRRRVKGQQQFLESRITPDGPTWESALNRQGNILKPTRVKNAILESDLEPKGPDEAVKARNDADLLRRAQLDLLRSRTQSVMRD